MTNNKKIFYGILIASVIIVAVTSLFLLKTPTIIPNSTTTSINTTLTAITTTSITITTTPSPRGQIIVKQSGDVGLLIRECSDREYIINTSDYIVEGIIEKVESKWNEKKTSIFTYTDLVIEKYIKGIPLTENRLQIITPGGCVGEICEAVEDQPIFHKGKKVGVYFQETDEEFSIVCSQFGVEEKGNAK